MDLLSQVKTADMVLKLLRGDFQHITPYGHTPQKLESEPNPEVRGLSFSTPEREGVPSAHIRRFFEELDRCAEINVHSVVLLRHGKIIAQASWKPHAGTYPHMMFSLSKSVTCMAVGMAVRDGLFSLDDKVAGFFPEKTGLFRNPRVNSVTVRHLLNMTAGMAFNELGSFVEKDWARAYLQSDCAFEPGSEFFYNSLNTYMLSAILCRKTGMGLVDYLTPRLFEPLQIPVPVWETCPLGIEKGGWGLYLRPVDMAKLGQLYLQRGRWTVNGVEKQLVPEEWVRESTEMRVKTNKSDAEGGYGYQIWNFSARAAYQFNGVFGQYVIVLPENDMVIAMTSGSKGAFTDHSCEIIAKYFGDDVPQLSEKPLPHNSSALRELRRTCENLRTVQDTAPPSVPGGFWERLFSRRSEELSPLAGLINGREYRMEKSPCTLLPLIAGVFANNFGPGVTKAAFSFLPGECLITLTEGSDVNAISAGMDGEPRYSKVTANGEVFTVGATARLFPDEDGRPVLKLFLSFIETPSTRVIKFIFYNNGSEDRLLMRFDEIPSIRDAAQMLLGLMAGGEGGLSRLLNDSIRQQKLAERVKLLSRPRVKGTRAKPGGEAETE